MIYIGYDTRESVCYDVCRYSIETNSKHKHDIRKLDLRELQHVHDRAPDASASTEFTYSRFLVPVLQEYQGWALFCDCDFIFLQDVDELLQHADDRFAVMVCKHDYKPTNRTKMDGQTQSVYPRKNWSSLVLWNCSHPANHAITSQVVNTQTGKYLHRFEWLQDDQIGSLPLQWNWLVGWYHEPDDGTPRALHYTEGGPWFDSCKDCEYADVWNKYHELYSSR
jgi:lipopolysaccharide biosynthesis glycosyltransferase